MNKSFVYLSEGELSLSYKQRVIGSNPLAPTIREPCD